MFASASQASIRIHLPENRTDITGKTHLSSLILAAVCCYTPRSLVTGAEDEATLGILTWFDLDLACSITRVTNPIHGIFPQIHLAIERVVGPNLDLEGLLQLLDSWPTPTEFGKALLNRLDRKPKKFGARSYTAYTQGIMQALNQQTVVVIGIGAV